MFQTLVQSEYTFFAYKTMPNMIEPSTKNNETKYYKPKTFREAWHHPDPAQ